MSPEPVSTVYFINSSRQSLRLIPPVVARRWLSRDVTAAKNTHNNKIIVEPVFFYRPCLIERMKAICSFQNFLLDYPTIYILISLLLFQPNFRNRFSSP
jgi:hypothetical protein